MVRCRDCKYFKELKGSNRPLAFPDWDAECNKLYIWLVEKDSEHITRECVASGRFERKIPKCIEEWGDNLAE